MPLRFYAETLDTGALLAALCRTLAAYPVLCGRYTADKPGAPPTAVVLNNAGVPVELCTLDDPQTSAVEAAARLPTAPGSVKPSFCLRDAHEAFVPAKVQMDPDVGSLTAPLCAIKITTLSGGSGGCGGGTAIGPLGWVEGASGLPTTTPGADVAVE